MSLILTSFKTTRQHYTIIGVAQNQVYVVDDIRERVYNRDPSLRVIYKGIYEATKWKILCTIPLKSVQNGCVNHGSSLAHYAITSCQEYILALARGTFERSSPGQVFVFRISLNSGKYEVFRCSGRSVPPSIIFACAECNDMTFEARNSTRMVFTTRGTNRNNFLMERENEKQGFFHWYSNTTPPSPSRAPALFALPNIHRQYIHAIIENQATPVVSFSVQSEWKVSSPFWRTLLSKGYFSNGVFITIIEGALLAVILRMPELKELAFIALQRAMAKPLISTRYYDKLHSPLSYDGISESSLKNLFHMNKSWPLVPMIS